MAVANTFSYDDASPSFELAKKALALRKDINESYGLVGRGRDYQQADCLNELGASLDPIIDNLSFVYNLVTLSSQMIDPMDELAVNDTLAINTSNAIKLLAESRRHALAQGALCSQSALVNTYAQKAATVADNATALLSAINMKSRRRR